MPKSGILVPLLAILVMAVACTTSEREFNPGDMRVNPMNPDASRSPATPVPERVSDLMEMAKQAYDSGHYESAFRSATQAESLLREYRIKDPVLLALSITIQGYCMLQMRYVDDYYIPDYGIQHGAVTRFKRAMREYPDDFRASLGLALSLFRRHGDSVRKADVLGVGVVGLLSMREEFAQALTEANPTEKRRRLRALAERIRVLDKDREKLLASRYIFHDPRKLSPSDLVEGKAGPWLGVLSEGQERLLLADVGDIFDEAVSGVQVEPDDVARVAGSLKAVADNWSHVQKHWRLVGLADLQASRDGLLGARDKIPDYFWVNRDLAFVYQSLGAFFLDQALDAGRLAAIDDGIPEERVEADARRRFLESDADSWEKRESAKNYRYALEFTEVFVRRHERFERQRVHARSERAALADDNTNPFLVDLVRRYQATMDELIQEERDMRESMILEAAVLCIDPLFQINDIRRAEVWATTLQALNPDSPLHHFVRGTAYFLNRDYELAKHSYEAFMKESSITADANRRQIARTRISQCVFQMRRQSGAGEPDRR